jgi:hypothetical protein
MVPRKNDDCIECKNVLSWKTAGLPVRSSSSCTFHVDGYRMGSPIHWNTELNILTFFTTTMELSRKLTIQH